MAQLELEQLHKDMLESISNRYQKTAGFPSYDFTRAFALAIMSLDEDVTAAEEHLNVDNLSGAELDEFIRQHRALTRKYGTFAEVELTLTAGEGDIQAGDLFSTASGIEFQAITDGHYKTGDDFTVRAVEAGSSGNVTWNTVNYMPVTIPGIGAVTNNIRGTGGYDAESDEDFRNRYYENLAHPDNGSNAQAYINWATSVPGVGRAIAYRLYGGSNSVVVEVAIVDADGGWPSGTDLRDAVQEAIDPNKNGDGSGLGPMGVQVNVRNAFPAPANISVHLEYTSGASASAVQAEIQQRVWDYYHSISLVEYVVKYSRIAEIISGTPGVLNYSNLKLNGGTTNVELATSYHIPYLQTFEVVT